MSKDHAAARMIMILVTCIDTSAMVTSEPKLLLKAMSRSVVLLQWGFVMMSMAHVSIGSLESRCAKSDPPFLGAGIAGPALFWILQLESWCHPSTQER